MNLAEVSIQKKTITLVMMLLMFVGGAIAYRTLSRLEDPEFTIKDALVITPYSGASAREVEEEVTNEIEKAVQQLGQLERVTSKSERGLSTVTVTIKDKYDRYSLPQVWDELRRKVNDAQKNLPPGAGPSLVVDDYGDVYGLFFAVTGDGYTYEEIRRYVDMLRRELLVIQDVKKVELYALQSEAVYVEISRQKMKSLGVSQEHIYTLLSSRNLVADGGRVQVGSEYIPIRVTGEYTSVEEIGELLISGGVSSRVVYLKDVATIRRGYVEPPTERLRFDGKPAIGLAISTVLGGNVVTMGEAIEKRLSELESQRPVGMETGVIAYQSAAVTKAVNGFVINLIEAVTIVIVVLLIFMGLRSGLIIGTVLLLTICATLVVMKAYEITLERISLGALIIALGMLVDNAIVITEGILIKIQTGTDRLKAAKDTVAQSMTPLLGATLVAIIAFAAIGLSQDSTGEYCRSLFYVLLISLMMSWVTAVTVTPLLCYTFLKRRAKAGESGGDQSGDPYKGKFYGLYRSLLSGCIRFRWITVGVMLGLLGLAVFAFGYVEQSFFPNSTRPQFMVDVWAPKGTYIEDTRKTVEDIEKHIMGLDHVTHVGSCIGKGAVRFILVYAPEKTDSGYAQLLVEVDDYRVIDKIKEPLQRHLDETYPDAVCLVKKFLLGPGEGGKIQVRFRGPDPEVLRRLSEKCEAIMHSDGGAVGVRNDWREKVKVVRADLREAQMQRAGITRPQVAQVLAAGFEGETVGIYRERNRLLPIIARAPQAERSDVRSISDLQIWSPTARKIIPLTQVVTGRFQTVWENPIIQRRNRVPTITVHCDQMSGNASVLFSRIAPKIDKMFEEYVNEYKATSTAPGIFTLEWGGEHEDSGDAQAALASSIPLFFILMVLIVIFLFNSIRQPLIIWCCVPLAIIGMTAGLLLTSQPFGFMAMLGLLSLSGMLIKNAIVLIDQINLEIRQGKDSYRAIIDSGVSRTRPVMMAAITTVMGMTPLVLDAFYVSMAVSIMFGLAFAAVLTLLIVPVLYAMFFRIRWGGKVAVTATEKN